MTVELHRTPHIVRLKIEEAQSSLVDLDHALDKILNHIDLLGHKAITATPTPSAQELLARAIIALESAHAELIDAQCDAEAALSRIA